MKVSDLIAKLQTMPQDMEVVKCESASCCCGDCFCPLDTYSDWLDVSIQTPYGIGMDGKTKAVVL